MPTTAEGSSDDRQNGPSNLNLASDLGLTQEVRRRDPGTNSDAIQHHELIDVGAGASNLLVSGAGQTEPGQQRRAFDEDEEGRVQREAFQRRDAMSDLWQNQWAYRANRYRMKDMFEELRAEVHSPDNARKSKAEIKDIFAFSSRGMKQIMRENPCEDRIAIQMLVVPTVDAETKANLEIEDIDSTPFSMFAVFDGHGGTACAEFLMKSVSTVLAHSPVLYDEDLEPFERRACATVDAFAELEKLHNEWAHENRDMSGSTAILSTFQDGILIMAGVGDSAALFVDHLGNADTLCPKHSTKNAQEVERVEKMGGTIVNGRVWGKLVPTRTIGDLDCKQESIVSPHGAAFSPQLAIESPVSPHPELKLAPIYAPPDDGGDHDEPFLVLASDGLWDVLSNERVADHTRKGLRKIREHEANEARRRQNANERAERLRGAGIGRRESFLKRITRPFSTSSLEDLSSSRHSSNLTRFSHRRGSWSGAVDEYLDLSLREVLDVSVRSGKGETPSAILDLNRYRGANADTGKGHATSGSSESTSTATERVLPPQRGLFDSTAETASLRTTGLKSHNVAEQLARMAKGARSMDDISVVVVTFKAGKDKGAPGSKGPQGEGPPVSVQASL